MKAVLNPIEQSGIAIVEFVIVLPLLLLLMLGTAEFGHALFQYNTLTKAVRDSARYLAANARLGSTGVIAISSPMRTIAQNLIVYGNPVGSGSALLPGFTRDAVIIVTEGSDHIRVTAAYDYVPMLFPDSLPTFGLGSPISLNFTLKASVTMRGL
jgi:Flp pilus assembly protein TadG